MGYPIAFRQEQWDYDTDIQQEYEFSAVFNFICNAT